MTKLTMVNYKISSIQQKQIHQQNTLERRVYLQLVIVLCISKPVQKITVTKESLLALNGPIFYKYPKLLSILIDFQFYIMKLKKQWEGLEIIYY